VFAEPIHEIETGQRYYEKGPYISLYYDASPNTIKDVEKILSMNDQVLRQSHLKARSKLDGRVHVLVRPYSTHGNGKKSGSAKCACKKSWKLSFYLTALCQACHPFKFASRSPRSRRHRRSVLDFL
jgi:hypothetical protein